MCTLMMVRPNLLQVRDGEIPYSLDPNPVADLYIHLYDAIQSNQPVGHGREGFYFGENDECCMYDVSKAICEALADLDKGKSPEPTSFTKEEIHKYLMVSTSLLYSAKT
jgi:hypothetical protein